MSETEQASCSRIVNEVRRMMGDFVSQLEAFNVQLDEFYDSQIEGGWHWNVRKGHSELIYVSLVQTTLYVGLEQTDFEGLRYSEELLRNILEAIIAGRAKKHWRGDCFYYSIQLPFTELKTPVISKGLGLTSYVLNKLGRTGNMEQEVFRPWEEPRCQGYPET